MKTDLHGKNVVVWGGPTAPLNSIRLQTGLLTRVLRNSLGANVQILDAKVAKAGELLRSAVEQKLPVLWPFGGFDRHLTAAVRHYARTIFIYHNITPAKYFWRTEPKVAFGSWLGQVQLRLIPASARWITCSPYNMAQLRARGFRHVALCPNIVDAEIIAPREPGKGPPRLMFVGRIVPNKACLELVEHARLAAEALRRPLHMTAVGAPKNAKCKYGKMFQRLVESMKSHPWLQIDWIRESVEPNLLAQLYRGATLYVSIALHEGFGLPVCEAIAAGVPALYSECGGTESILAGVGAVPVRERARFWEHILNVLNNDDERNRLVRRQQQIVRGFVEPDVIGAIETAYQPIAKAG